jgi:hypothetical protein
MVMMFIGSGTLALFCFIGAIIVAARGTHETYEERQRRKLERYWRRGY